MKQRNFLLIILCIGVLTLSGCASDSVKYNPDEFVSPNRIIQQKVPVEALPSVKATYGIGNDPTVVNAYNIYARTGKQLTVRSNGWVTYPYNPNAKPIIACSPFHFCTVQLESGEKLNYYGLGDTDSRDWVPSAFVTGEGPAASISIQIKPAQTNLSTDLTISTNKRTYLIGLVSKPNAGTTMLRFYYPEETMISNISKANKMQDDEYTQVINSTSLSGGTQVSLSNLNFNYKIKGDSPPWRPLRVYDDGNKTYIQMPGIASRFNLPVLYLLRNKQMQMVNYRYEDPYFVVDGLFGTAWLVSGKGHDQQRVEILNKNIQG